MTTTNGHRRYRTKHVLTGFPQGLAWKILEQTLAAVNRYRDGVCARCGESIRVQGDSLCAGCLLEADELGAGDDDAAALRAREAVLERRWTDD